MKITKTLQEKKFEPINVLLQLITKEEALAFFAISRWDITIPDETAKAVGATKADVRAMIKRFQDIIGAHNVFPEKAPMPRVEVTFEAQYEVDEAKRTETIPGLSDALTDKPQLWRVGDTVYLRGFYPKRTIQFAAGGLYQIVDEEGNLQGGPYTSSSMTRMFSSPAGTYTHEVQKRRPQVGDTLYHEGTKGAERLIVATPYGVKIANANGKGHHYWDVTTLDGIEKLIDAGIYTYERC